jgi:hypothetical protein
VTAEPSGDGPESSDSTGSSDSADPGGVPGAFASGDGPVRGPRLMRTVTAVMVAAGLLIAVLAGPLAAWSRDAAGDLVDRTAYRAAVLHGKEAP